MKTFSEVNIDSIKLLISNKYREEIQDALSALIVSAKMIDDYEIKIFRKIAKPIEVIIFYKKDMNEEKTCMFILNFETTLIDNQNFLKLLTIEIKDVAFNIIDGTLNSQILKSLCEHSSSIEFNEQNVKLIYKEHKSIIEPLKTLLNVIGGAE